MTYILAPERDEDPAGAFERYADYLRRESARFPRRALELATSDWYLGMTDHRAPHDAWLLSASFEESGRDDRQQERAIALRLCLLGAYHDQELEFYYPRVFAYRFWGDDVQLGHGDWRYDEFRLNEDGRLIHEIQWSGKAERATWLIHADDVVFTSLPVTQK